MVDNEAILSHLEKIHEDYIELVDKVPTEDKIIMSREEAVAPSTLEPWEISEIVQAALNSLPGGLEAHFDSLFDVVYDAVAEAVDRIRS